MCVVYRLPDEIHGEEITKARKIGDHFVLSRKADHQRGHTEVVFDALADDLQLCDGDPSPGCEAERKECNITNAAAPDGCRSVCQKLVFDRLPEVKEISKTSKRAASAYIGTVVRPFAQ